MPTPVEGLGHLLRDFDRASKSDNRAARHFLRLDMNETWNFARLYPDKLAVAAP